ncbi:MAG: hypothetical protein SGPRY_009451, partial [Prymnesium sp.]
MLAVGRTYPSDAVATLVLPQLIASFNWANVGVIYESSSFGSNYNEGLRTNSASSSVTVLRSVSFTGGDRSSFRPACEALREVRVNIVVAVAYADDLALLLRACEEVGMWGPGYVWILPDSASASPSLNAAVLNGLAENETASLLNGLLSFYATPKLSDGFARLRRAFESSTAEDCENPLFDTFSDLEFVNSSSHVFGSDDLVGAAYMYDCVVALASAFSAATDPSDGTEVAARFRSVNFDGASGRVQFNSISDRSESTVTYALYNWVAKPEGLLMLPAGTISLSTPFMREPSHEIEWHNSVLKPVDLLQLPKCPDELVRRVEVNGPRCIPCPPGKTPHAGDTCIDKVGKLGIMLPVTANGRPTSRADRSLVCAATLALQHVNSRSEAVVEGLSSRLANLSRLEAIFVDSGSDSSETLLAYSQLTASNPPHAIVGPKLPAAAAGVSSASTIQQLPICSLSSETTLSNKLLYPYVVRTFPSNAAFSAIVLSAMESLGYRRVALLYDEGDAYLQAFATDLRRRDGGSIVEISIHITFVGGFTESYASAASALSLSSLNIVLLGARDIHLLGLLSVAQAEGVWGEGYVWFSSDLPSTVVVAQHAALGLSRAAAVRLLSGMMVSKPSALGTEGFARYLRSFTSQQPADCSNELFNVSEYPKMMEEANVWDFGASVYDCVIALALGMAQTLFPQNGIELSRVVSGLTFDGASGDMQFDPETADRASSVVSIAFFNWQEREGELVDQYVSRYSLMSGVVDEDVEVVWPGGLVGRDARPKDVTTVPLDCPTGYIVSNNPSRGLVCEICPPGSYERLHTICELASSNQYIPLAGQNISGARDCPPHTSTLRVVADGPQPSVLLTDGASSISQCLCDP